MRKHPGSTVKFLTNQEAIQEALQLLEANGYFVVHLAPLSADQIDMLCTEAAGEQRDAYLMLAKEYLSQPSFEGVPEGIVQACQVAIEQAARNTAIEFDRAIRRVYTPEDWAWSEARDKHPFFEAREDRRTALVEHVNSTWLREFAQAIAPLKPVDP